MDTRKEFPIKEGPFAEFLLEISSGLDGFLPSQADQLINHVLERLARYFAADRSYLILQNEADCPARRYEWYAPGVEPRSGEAEPAGDQGLGLPGCMTNRDSLALAADAADFPVYLPESEGGRLRVPLFARGSFKGYLGLERRKNEPWPEETADRLGVAGKLLVDTLTDGNPGEGELPLGGDLYRQLVENAFDGIFIQKDIRIIFANKRLAEMLGVEEGELNGKEHWLIYHPDYRELTRDRGRARLRGEEVPPRYEVVLIRKDGSTFPGEIFARRILIGGSDPGIFVWVRDITERKRAEELAIQAKEQAERQNRKNALLAEIGQVVSSGLDLPEIYESFAREAARVIPFDRLAVNLISGNQITVAYTSGLDLPDRRPGAVASLGGNFSRYIMESRCGDLIQLRNEEEIAKILSRFPGLASTIEAGLRGILGVPLISKDRVIGVLNFRSRKIDLYTDDDLKTARQLGNLLGGAIANARLHEELKQAEKEARKSEARYAELFNEAPVGYHELDGEGRIVRVNRTELEILGYDEGEMLGQPVWRFIEGSEESRIRTLAKLAGTLPVGKVIERVYLRKDGGTVPVLLEERLNRDRDGRIVGMRTVLQDISTRKKEEEEKRSLEEKLFQARRMESLGYLAGGIAHDFNNLLTVIRGYTELLLLDLPRGLKLEKYVEEIQKAADRAADLVSQLLSYSRKQMLVMEVLDINVLLGKMEKTLSRILPGNIEISYLLDPDLGRVKADQDKMGKVLEILARNARDAMAQGGKLTIATANVLFDDGPEAQRLGLKPGPYVVLSVADTGIGMTRETLARIFDPFFTTKEVGKGRGLGLSALYGIVKQSGGEIEVSSEPGQGTVFKIYLPREGSNLYS